MRKFHFFPILSTTIALAAIPGRAQAHLVNTDVGEFYAGMLHPLTSAEHMLPMLALALLAGQCNLRAGRWTTLLFPLALVAGIMIGKNFISMGTTVHLLNLAALVVLGVMLIFAHRITFLAVTATAWAVGLILGYRSGIDMTNAGVKMQFIPGVALTGFIVMALVTAWVPKADKGLWQTLRQIAGVAFAAGGMIFLSLLLFGGSEPVVRSIGMPDDQKLTLMLQSKHLTLPVLFGLFIGAIGWGAAHSLTPGHGKAIVGAYLVGARATGWHAVYLGLTVTATHTLGIFVLGLVTLFASKYIVAEDLYPWLGAISGLLVLTIGLNMMIRRWQNWRVGDVLHEHHHHGGDHDHDNDCEHVYHHDHGHDHGHGHLPPGADGTPVTWKSLLALGISGGLLPCPSALVLLLAAVSQHRIALGLALVVAFSLGLAGVLTAVGLLFVKGGRLFESYPTRISSLAGFLPLVSSLAIAVLGAVIIIQSASEISF